MSPPTGRRPAATATALPEPGISEFDGVRYLHLGTPWVQGAMRLRKPRALELAYIQRMMAALLLMPEDWLQPGSGAQAVQLGLGAAAITRFTHQEMGWPTTAVELNPGVIAACRHWFRLPADGDGLQVVCADALAWLQQAAPASAQLLSVDLYDHEAAAPVLDDADFYGHCHALLAEGGVMAVNLFGRQASFADSAARIAQAFGTASVWRLSATREGNTIVLAGRGVDLPARAVLQQRADALQQRLGLPAAKWLRGLRPVDADPAR